MKGYRRWIVTLTTVLVILTLSACSTYKDRVAPVPLPSLQLNHVEIDGVLISANAYIDDDAAGTALGFDARKAGLIPVRFVIDNQSTEKVKVNPDQTFLVDTQGQAWPLLSAEQAYNRVKNTVEIGETFKGAITSSVLAGAAGAVAGFAIGVLSGGNVAKIMGKGAAVGASIGAIGGSTNRYSELDGQLRNDLYQKTLQNRTIRQG
ncbi:MAG TPA: hypothetical protein ENJ32_00955, partial [Crenotrichaceae bacterium]|nr:hypothetical protein [Crenotrichaceae bacterium]